MAELSGVWVDWVNDPRIIWVDAPRTEISIQDLVDTIRGVLEYDMGALDDPSLISEAAGKQFLGGTTFVGLTMELNNAMVAFEGRTIELTDGYLTEADPLGKTLIDAYANFISTGVTAGDLIYNHTDNSKATILSIRSETELITTPLTGGITNQYNIDDLYDLYDIISCEVSGGNLVAVDYDGYTIEQVLPTFGTRVKITAASSATQTENSAIQYSSYQNAVWVDVNATHIYATGVAYPTGTREYPVNNLADAVAIANSKGFSTLQILSNMTLDSGTNISGFEVIGKSHVNTFITVSSSAICNNITIANANVTGILDGGTHIRECMVGNLTYVNGHIHDSGLYGTIVLDGDEDAVFMNCGMVDPGSIPIIDMNVNGQDCVCNDWSGKIIFRNLASAANQIYIQIDGGRVILEDTITAGDITISGVGILEDYSTGTTVNTDGLMSKETITEITFNEVWIDTEDGSAGTAFPLGTQSYPVNNIEDAQTIAIAHNIHSYKVRGSITLNDDYPRSRFTGVTSLLTCIINLDGYDVSDTFFDLLQINGTMGGTNAQFKECYIVDVSNLSGIAANSSFQGTITLGPMATGLLGTRTNCVSDPTIFDMVGPGRVLKLATSGDIKLLNSSASCDTTFGMTHGSVEIDNTCTAGSVNISGICSVMDNSGSGCVVEREAQLDSSPGAYQGFIFIDTISGVSGVRYPIGTPEQPVDNIIDAYAIATSIGIHAYKVRGEITLDRDYPYWMFRGTSTLVNDMVNLDGYDVSSTFFDLLQIQGIMGGTNAQFKECYIIDVSNLSGIAANSSFQGTITLGPIASGLLGTRTNCVSDPTIFDMVGPGRVLKLATSGDIKLLNSSASCDTTFGMTHGSVEIDSTCISGTVNISGICSVIDNSDSGCLVLRDAQIDSSPGAYNGFVHIDTTGGGKPGTEYPIGTATEPVDNIIDAYAIASNINIRAYKIRGSVTLQGDRDNWTFEGWTTPAQDIIYIDGYSINHAFFRNLTVSGAMSGFALFSGGYIASMENFSGAIQNCIINDSITLGGPGSILQGISCGAVSNPSIIDAVGAGRIIQMTGNYGNWEIRNMGVGSVTSVGFQDGSLLFGATNTGGTATIRGRCALTNTTGGTTVVDQTLTPLSIDTYQSSIHGSGSWEGSGSADIIAEAVWDEYRAGHTIPGTFGGDFSTAGATAAEIDAYLSANHGDGNWEGTGGITVEEIDAYLSNNHGDGSWEGSGSAAIIAEAVWDEYRSLHTISGTFGGDFSTAGATASQIDAYLSINHGDGSWEGSTSGDVANAVWATVLPGVFGADTAGERLATTDGRIDQSLSSTESNIRGSDSRDLTDLAGTGFVGSTDSLAAADDDRTAIKSDTATILLDTDEIQGKLPTNNIMGSSVKTDKDDEIDAILVDTNEIQSKLPDNNIMGSSVKTNKDDEIDAILADTANMQPKIGTPATGTLAGDIAAANTDIDTVKVDTAAILLDTADIQPKIGAPITGTLAGDIAAANTDIDAVKVDTTAILLDTADIQPKIGAPITGTLAGDIAAANTDIDAVKIDTATILIDTADMQPKIGAPATGTLAGDIAAANTDIDAVKADTAAILIDTADMQPKIGTPITGTLAGDIAAMISQLARVLGLEHENAFVDNTVNDDYGQLTSSRVRIFNSKANTEAATDGGSETTGLIATYTVTAVYEAVGRLKSYRMVKE